MRFVYWLPLIPFNSTVILRYYAQPVYAQVEKSCRSFRPHPPVFVLQYLSEVLAVIQVDRFSLAVGLGVRLWREYGFSDLLSGKLNSHIFWLFDWLRKEHLFLAAWYLSMPFACLPLWFLRFVIWAVKASGLMLCMLVHARIWRYKYGGIAAYRFRCFFFLYFYCFYHHLYNRLFIFWQSLELFLLFCVCKFHWQPT